MEEIWKSVMVEGFDHECYVSNTGKVKNFRGYLLAYINMGDCIRVTLKANKKQRRMAVHRLVAYAFLDVDIKNKSIVVKHIDGDIYNNSVDNLKAIDRSIEKTKHPKKDIESGITNVNWYIPLKKWKVAYRTRRKKQEFFRHIGYFNSLEDAKNVNELWSGSFFKKIIPDVKYPGLLYLEGEKKWRVDVFDPEGNLYHIDHYTDKKEAFEEWKLYHGILNRKR